MEQKDGRQRVVDGKMEMMRVKRRERDREKGGGLGQRRGKKNKKE